MLSSYKGEYNDNGLFFHGYSSQKVNFCRLYILREIYENQNKKIEFPVVYQKIFVDWYTHHLSYIETENLTIKIPSPPSKLEVKLAIDWIEERTKKENTFWKFLNKRIF
jgi:hypothetical protein